MLRLIRAPHSKGVNDEVRVERAELSSPRFPAANPQFTVIVTCHSSPGFRGLDV